MSRSYREPLPMRVPTLNGGGQTLHAERAPLPPGRPGPPDLSPRPKNGSSQSLPVAAEERGLGGSGGGRFVGRPEGNGRPMNREDQERHGYAGGSSRSNGGGRRRSMSRSRSRSRSPEFDGKFTSHLFTHWPGRERESIGVTERVD